MLTGKFSLLEADQTTIQKFIKDAVNDIQGAWKCAVSQLNDINPLGLFVFKYLILKPNITNCANILIVSC